MIQFPNHERITGLWTPRTAHGWRYDNITAARDKKTGRNPTDRGKQGVKPSLMTDTGGFLCHGSQQQTGMTSNWWRTHPVLFRRGVRGKNPDSARTKATKRPG
ncbi:hypothetical protein [Erwinia tracheiphila]